MKLQRAILVFGLLGGLTVLAPLTRAELEVSASVRISAVGEFHAPLAVHGSWVEVGTSGRCWRPAGVALTWRPYCHGRWIWTDCGWYWESDEPWSWAVYHYGHWVYDPGFGWVWVPGIEWAPAWVEWRFGGGYCGWAPLAPRGVVIAPSLFVFVESRRFCDPIRPTTVVINNTTVINKAKLIGSVSRTERRIDGTPQRVVVNTGPGADFVEKAGGRKVTTAPIREVAARASVPDDVRRKSGKAAKPETKPGKSPAVGERDRQPSAPDRARPPRDSTPDRVAPDSPGKGKEPAEGRARGKGRPGKEPKPERDEGRPRDSDR